MNERAMGPPAAGVVRVVGPEKDGAGFLASLDGLIVTCAHVIDGLGPGSVVSVEPHVGRRPLTAVVESLQDPPDVAVLRLVGSVPPGLLVLPLGRSPRIPQPGLRTFGYPELRPEEGLPGELTCYGSTAADGYDQLALRSEETTLGFSGAPIWDPELGAVAGMVKSIASQDRAGRLGSTAIGVPVEVIRDLHPGLRLPEGQPYRGLEPFTEEHVDYYYGREHATSQLLASLGTRDLALVVAVSGGGKSSLLRAGLAKGLLDHQVVSLAQRIRCYQRVISQPHAELMDCLASQGIAVPPGLAGASAQELADAIHRAAPVSGVVVVIDQFERLYTHCQADERKRFLELLPRLAADRVKVVIGLRADFYHLVLNDLGEGLAGDHVALARMSEPDLVRAITAPADRLLRSFQPGLVQRLIADTRGPGDLPLLQFALTELWQQDAAGGVLTEATYEAMGVDLPDGEHLPGARGALIRWAEQLWQELSPDDQQRLPRILLGLVAPQPVEANADRPEAGARDLGQAAMPAQWDEDDQRLIRRLTDARLLTTNKAAAGGQGTVEVCHEVLLRAWPRLRGWLRKYSEFVRWRATDLAPNLERWLISGDKPNPGFLLPRPLLAQALVWLGLYPGLLAGRAEDYIKASERRRARWRRLRTSAVAVAAAVLIAFLIVLISLRQAAVGQARTAQSEAMAAEAASLLPVDGPLGMLLSLQAYDRAPTPAARSALIEAAQQPLDVMLLQACGSVQSVAFSAKESMLAAGCNGGDIGLWHVTSGPGDPRLQSIDSLHEGSTPFVVSFSPDGTMLAAGDKDGDIRIWNVHARKKITVAVLHVGGQVKAVAFSPNAPILATSDGGSFVDLWTMRFEHNAPTFSDKTPVLHMGGSVNSVAFSADGSVLAAGAYNGGVKLWNVKAGRAVGALARGNSVNSVAFSPNGRTMAVGVIAENVTLWDAVTWQRTATLAEGSRVNGVAFGPNGKTLAVGDDAGGIGLWDAMAAPDASLDEGHPVRGVALNADGTELAAGDLGGNVIRWNPGTGDPYKPLPEGGPVYSVALNADGTELAAGDIDGNIVVWTNGAAQRTIKTDRGPVNSVALSPDGSTLAVGENGGLLLYRVTGDSVHHTPTNLPGNPVKAVSPVNTVSFTADGKKVAAGDNAGQIRLWSAQTGQLIKTLTLKRSVPVEAVAFTSDGNTLVAGDNAGNIGLWDVATGEETAMLAEGSQVTAVTFGPDNRTLVAGDLLGNVTFWDTSTRQQLASLPAANGGVRGLAYSQMGQVLAVGGEDSTVTILRLNLADLSKQNSTDLICQKVQGQMPQSQLAKYVPGSPDQETCPPPSVAGREASSH